MMSIILSISIFVISCIVFPIFCIVGEYKNNVSMKIIIVNVAVASGVQVIWTFGYMFSLYIYNKTTTYNLFLFIIFFTILIMYKIVRRLSYQLVTGCIITPILSFVWLQIDNSPFRDIPFDGIGEGLTPIFLPIFFVCFQASILMAIKIQSLLAREKQKEKQALKIIVIQDIKILCFQVLLSMVLAGALILNNLFVSYLIITLSLYILFIIRKKKW